MRILHIIAGLKVGGAEQAMARVVRGLRRRGTESVVVSLTGGGRIGDELAEEGVPVIALGMTSPASVWRGAWRLRRVAAEQNVDLVQGWMYHGNLFAVAIRDPKVPLVFGIRHSLPTLHEEKRMTRLVIRLGGLLSGTADAIVYNAQSSRPQHERLGYASRGAIWIPNGFDTERFRPDPWARSELRQRLGIGDSQPLVGMVARFHPIKDHALFLAAAAVVSERLPAARFLLAGRGVGDDSAGLRVMAQRLNIADRVIFLEDQEDVPGVMNALDVACLTSKAEGFPNVVAEAMSCGTLVVATDVGDVSTIIGNAGVVVPPGNVAAFANGLFRQLFLAPGQRIAESESARQRIVTNFSESTMIESFWRLYAKTISVRKQG